MKKPKRLSLRLQIRNFNNTFFQIGDLPFKTLIPDSLVKSLRHSGSGHDTIFTPLVTLKAFLLQVLNKNGSCKEAVANVIMERISNDYEANSVNTGAYCKARQRLPLPILKNMLVTTGKVLHQQSSSDWLWKGFRVALVDGTTLLMPDTKDNQASYPQQSTQKEGIGFPILRMVSLISLPSKSCLGYETAPYKGKGTGETSLFSKLIPLLDKNDLLLGDRYYTTFAISYLLIQQGTSFVFRQSPNVKTDFKKGNRLGDKDHLIHNKKPSRKPVWMTKEAYAELPAELLTREFAVKGTVYVTSLLESKIYSKKELAKLYEHRWKVELDLRSIKTDMKMEMLHCQSARMVDKEIAVNLLAYNLVCANIVHSASVSKKKPRDISFMAVVQLMHCFLGLCVTMSGKTLEKLLYPLLKAMANTEIGKRNRPNQPRVIKRRPKAFPLMTKPRKEYAII
jgi:hypothetical protein